MEMPTRRMAITNLHVSKREVKEKKQRGGQRSKNRVHNTRTADEKYTTNNSLLSKCAKGIDSDV